MKAEQTLYPTRSVTIWIKILPCFVWSTGEDTAVLPENSFRFVQALRAAKVPYDFHIYQTGPHGIGLSVGKGGVPAGDVHPWGKDLLFWFRQNGWAK